MSEIDYGRLERAIMDGMGYANSSHSPEDLRRERNYQILQAAAVILMNGNYIEKSCVDQAIALLEEIEGREK